MAFKLIFYLEGCLNNDHIGEKPSIEFDYKEIRLLIKQVHDKKGKAGFCIALTFTRLSLLL